jgi:hypothetical protein
MARKVVLFGLHPDVVDFDKWPGLSAEKLMSALESEKQSLIDEGFEAEVCLVDTGETADAVARAKLSEGGFDCVVIGAGVRKDDDHFILFEKLINLAHEMAPGAKIAFNTGPDDTAAAVKRWVAP